MVQGLAQLDTFAGQFFGGRDFGSGVLGAIGPDWRLVVAEQDYAQIKPVPDLKLPAFALVIDLKPDDDDFAQRLKVAFQSFIGLANLGAAQTKAPPLELGSEIVDGVTIATSHFMAPKAAPRREGAGPPAAQLQPVGRAGGQPLHPQLEPRPDPGPDPGPPQAARQQTDVTAILEADGPTLAQLARAEPRPARHRRTCSRRGTTRPPPSGQIDLLLNLLRYAGRGTLTAQDGADAVEFRLDFALGAK